MFGANGLANKKMQNIVSILLNLTTKYRKFLLHCKNQSSKHCILNKLQGNVQHLSYGHTKQIFDATYVTTSIIKQFFYLKLTVFIIFFDDIFYK